MDDKKSEVPLVSIGMPVRNGRKFISRSIKSLLEQDYQNVEIIVSDNASEDGTLEYLLENASEKIKIIRQKKLISIQDNFMETMHASTGKFFMWAGVDDYWHSGFVSVLVKELLEHEKSCLAMCAIDTVDSDRNKIDTIRFTGKGNPNYMSHLRMTLALDTPVKYNIFIYGLYRLSFLKSALIPPQIVCADRRFLMQFSMACKLRYVDQVLHVRTVHQVPYDKRYGSSDQFSKIHIEYRSKLSYFHFKPIYTVLKIITYSTIIPYQRKLIVPVVMVVMLYRAFMYGIKMNVKEFLSNPSFKKSREFFRR